MLKNLLKKNFRDFRSHASEFSSVFILSLLSILIFSGLLAASQGMEEKFEKWSESSNMADEWVTIRDQQENKVLQELKDKKSIDQVMQQQYLNVKVGTASSKKQLQLVIDNGTISKPAIIKGDKFSTQTKGIWLDSNFAKENDYKVDSNIQLNVNGETKSYLIKGLVASPNFIAYTGPANDIVADHEKYGYVLTNTKTIPSLKNASNQILVTKNEEYSEFELKEDLKDVLGTSLIDISNRNEKNNVSEFIQKKNSIKKLSIMFCTVLFALVILTTETTIRRLVNKQRSIIGLLRALGLSKFKIILHYVQYGFLPTLFGGTIGLFFGPRTIAPLILDKQKPLFNMPYWEVTPSKWSWIMLGVLVLIGSIAGITAILKTLKDAPAKIMQPQKIKRTPKNIVEMFPRLWDSLSWDWRWVLRDISRAKLRALIGIFGVIGSLMLLISGLGIQQSLNDSNEKTFGSDQSYKNEIKISPTIDKSIMDLMDSELNGDYQTIQQLPANLSTSRKDLMSLITIVEPGIYMNFNSTDYESVNLEKEDGVFISDYISKQLNVRKGDSIKLIGNFSEQNLIVPIAGILKVGSPQGIVMSKDYWGELEQLYVPTTVLTGQKVSKKISDDEDVVQVNSLAQNLESANKVLTSFQSIIILLIVFAVLLSWFILYNLGALNFTERYREYATLRVLGFRLNEIRSIIIKDSIATWIMGTIIGIPLGLLFLDSYVALANSTTTQFFMHISSLRLGTAILIVLFNVILISLFISRQVKKMDMATALKSVE
ncbi:ABC transporter permease [Virgibacillus pantothenticus]|uniref:ABC transporter permease n=1 Tax=Virgibacillus pantothenticus TaxID=1473 RepID=UPI0025AF3E5F|nr:ABC transporter permease [Virgibacillus pantothenticus]